MLPRRAGEAQANSFEQFWSGLVPSRDRLSSPGPGHYMGLEAGFEATSSHTRPPSVRLPPRLPPAPLSSRLVRPPQDSSPGVGYYDINDGIGSRAWRARHSRPGGGLPSARVSEPVGSRSMTTAARARLLTARVQTARAREGMTAAAARSAASGAGILSEGTARNPGELSSRSVIIGTEGLHHSDAPNRLGYRSGWVTGSAHASELPPSTGGPGAYDVARGERATRRDGGGFGGGGFARSKAAGAASTASFAKSSRFGWSGLAGGVGRSPFVQSREARTEHFVRTRPMTTSAGGHRARIDRARHVAKPPPTPGAACPASGSRSRNGVPVLDMARLGAVGRGGAGGSSARAVLRTAAAGDPSAGAEEAKVSVVGGGSSPRRPFGRPPSASGREGRGGRAAGDGDGGGVGGRERAASGGGHAAPRPGTASSRAAGDGAEDGDGGDGEGGEGPQATEEERDAAELKAARQGAWEDEDILGIGDRYARHAKDFLARNRAEVAAASVDPAGRSPRRRKAAGKVEERMARFNARRAALQEERERRHAQLRDDYEHKLVRKQQRLWLGFLALGARSQRLVAVLRGRRAERVSLRVLRALGMHKRRVFRAWAAWVKHKRLIWATTVFKARLRPMVRRFRIASRVQKVAVIVSFLASVEQTNNAVRAARIFHARILRLQAFWKACLETTRAQKRLLRRQFDRACLAIRVQGLKRRLRHERRKSDVDRQLVVLARRQAQEEERARGFLRKQQSWDDAVGAGAGPAGAGQAEAAPAPETGRRTLGRGLTRSDAMGDFKPSRPPGPPRRQGSGRGAGAAGGGPASGEEGGGRPRRRRRSSVVASIHETERYLESADEAVRSLGVIRRARRASTVFDPAAAAGAGAGAAGDGGGAGAGAGGQAPHEGDEEAEGVEEAAGAARRPGHGRSPPGPPARGGASDVDLAAEERRRVQLYRAEGDEDTQWETILAKLLSQSVPRGVEEEARIALEEDAVAPEAAPPPERRPPPPGPRGQGRSRRTSVPRVHPGEAEQRVRDAVADLPTTTADGEEGGGPDSPGRAVGGGRQRRLSIEMAVMRVRTLEEWPPVPESRLSAMLTEVLKRHRKQHFRAMERHREQLHRWQLGFEAEARKAEARIASIRSKRITKAERAAIREYLKARQPSPPRFFVLEPWEGMIELATESMTEQRRANADPRGASAADGSGRA